MYGNPMRGLPELSVYFSRFCYKLMEVPYRFSSDEVWKCWERGRKFCSILQVINSYPDFLLGRRAF